MPDYGRPVEPYTDTVIRYRNLAEELDARGHLAVAKQLDHNPDLLRRPQTPRDHHLTDDQSNPLPRVTENMRYRWPWPNSPRRRSSPRSLPQDSFAGVRRDLGEFREHRLLKLLRWPELRQRSANLIAVQGQANEGKGDEEPVDQPSSVVLRDAAAPARPLAADTRRSLRSGVARRVRPEPGAVVQRVEGVHVLGGQLEFEDVGVLGDPLG
jgi:hypothetical protein